MKKRGVRSPMARRKIESSELMAKKKKLLISEPEKVIPDIEGKKIKVVLKHLCYY